MKFARHWVRLSTAIETATGRRHVSALGWSDVDEVAARSLAEERLARNAERCRQGLTPRGCYGYATDRPLSEAPFDTLLDARGRTLAVLTRNAYGAIVLNTERALFIDVDFPTDAPKPGFFAGLFGKSQSAEERALERLEEAFAAHGRGAFRVYRTQAGLRLVALDLELDGFDEGLLPLLERFGSDPLYVKLCAAQRCFRARLTPKPWRIGCPDAPARFPFSDAGQESRFRTWLASYEASAEAYATCRPLTTLGLGHPTAAVSAILDVHDRFTLNDGASLA